MGRMGSFKAKDLEKFRDELQKLAENTDEFAEACAKELTARLLRMVIKRTPVGEYPQASGKKGGTLRRGWTTQESGSGSEGLKTRSVSQLIDTLKVHHLGNTYVIDITNLVEYAAYVEYGHRTANKKGWVRGKFMMTISERELERIAPRVLENKIKKYLEGCLK